MVVERVGSDPSDLRRLGNKGRVVGVVVVLPPVRVQHKTTAALFLLLLLLLVAAGGSSSSRKRGTGLRLRRACTVLRGALIWNLPVATVVVEEEEGEEGEEEAVRVNVRTNKSFVCLGCLGIRMGCSLALLLLRWALLRLGGRGRVARWRTLRRGRL